MRILEIGHVPLVSTYAPGCSDFFGIGSAVAFENHLTFPSVLKLRRRLKAGDYDLVVYHITGKVSAPWHKHQSFARMLAETATGSLIYFHKIAWHYFHAFYPEKTAPLVVIDTQDVPRITKSESYWLDRSRFWFMRELPPNHMNLFLNMDRRCGDVTNIRRNEFLARNFSKIEPFSLGFEAPKEAARKLDSSKKIYDIFYAGANHTTTVRQNGLEELRALKASGLRVFIPETRLSQADFFRACAQAWLVWSPEGQGWDCHRHYEALTAWSVPLINLPTIERLWPFHDGEHCLYYRPEAGGLTEAVTRALQDRAMLVKIAEQGRAYVFQHHQRTQLVQHVLRKMELLAKAEPYLAKSAPAAAN